MYFSVIIFIMYLLYIVSYYAILSCIYCIDDSIFIIYLFYFILLYCLSVIKLQDWWKAWLGFGSFICQMIQDLLSWGIGLHPTPEVGWWFLPDLESCTTWARGVWFSSPIIYCLACFIFRMCLCQLLCVSRTWKFLAPGTTCGPFVCFSDECKFAF